MMKLLWHVEQLCSPKIPEGEDVISGPNAHPVNTFGEQISTIIGRISDLYWKAQWKISSLLDR